MLHTGEPYLSTHVVVNVFPQCPHGDGIVHEKKQK